MTSQIQNLVVTESNGVYVIPESNLISFNYSRKTDVKVRLGTTTANLEQKTYLVDWEITTDNRVRLQASLFSGTVTNVYKLQIYRETDSTTPVHEFQAGSSIRAADLNNVNKQTLYVAEEIRDVVNSLAAGGSNIGQLLINGSNIQDGSINSSKLTDPAVNTVDIVDVAVTTAKIADNAVTTAKIPDDAITTDKLANSINTTIAGKANTGANLSTFTNDTNYITAAQVPTSFVTGMILMYTGTTAPTGWALCDGTNGTPDLRNRFIVGQGSTYSINSTGGLHEVTLTSAQMPSHEHSTNIDGTHVIPGVGSSSYPYGGAGSYASTVFNMNPTGGGQPHENLPPYYALAYIMKL